MKISIVGAGSWGSALALALAKVADITLYCRKDSQVATINQQHKNPQFLPEGTTFSNNIVATSNLDECVIANLIIMATPLNALRDTLLQLKPRITSKTQIPDFMVVCKGFEVNTGMLPHQIFKNVFSDVENIPHYGTLLGPSFAQEVVYELPTAITLSGNNLDFVFKWIDNFKTIPYFRVYAGDDVIGAEVGAGVKNIVAIAAGIVDGLSLGSNARAALITRSLNELSTLVSNLGGNKNTIYGLTGLGDLILTCTGDLSRNRQVGIELAKGKPLSEILNNLGHVAEGVYSTNEVYQLSKKHGLDMPIVETVYNILNGKTDIKSSIIALFNREPKLEFIKMR